MNKLALLVFTIFSFLAFSGISLAQTTRKTVTPNFVTALPATCNSNLQNQTFYIVKNDGQYICKNNTFERIGAAGNSTIARTAPEIEGVNCENGGTKLELGQDANKNNILETSEVQPQLTTYLCNGVDGGSNGTVANATTTNAGKVLLSASGTTTVVSTTDARYQALQETRYISEFGNNLITAVNNIGTVNDTALEIPTNITVTAGVTVPNNIRLIFSGNGALNVNTSIIVTIRNGLGLRAPPDKYIFQGAGNVVFAGGSAGGAGVANIVASYPANMYPEWFGAVGDKIINDLPAFQKLQNSMQITSFGGGNLSGGHIILSKATYYLANTFYVTKSIKMVGQTSRDVNGTDIAFLFPPNTKGFRIMGDALGAEFSGFGVYGQIDNSATNTVVNTTSGSLTINLVGGAITQINPGFNTDATTGNFRGVVPGSTVNINGFNYLLGSGYQDTGVSAPTLLRPRLVLGRNADVHLLRSGNNPGSVPPLTTSQIADVSSYYNGDPNGITFPTNNDWAGQVIKINGDASYTITSHTNQVITLNKAIPEGVYLVEVMGIKTQANIPARINYYHGFDVGSQIKLKNVVSTNFAGNGFSFHTSRDPYSNTNNSSIERSAGNSNLGSGWAFYGFDSNNSEIRLIDAQQNRGAGIFESVTLGNNFYGFHVAWNQQGAASFYGGNAENNIQNSYTEGGQPPMIVSPNTVIIGGNLQSGYDRIESPSHTMVARGGRLTVLDGIQGSNNIGKHVQGTNTFGTGMAIGIPSYVPNTINSWGSAEEPVNSSAGVGQVLSYGFVWNYNNIKRGWYSLFNQQYQGTGTDEPQTTYGISGDKSFEGVGQFWLHKGFYGGFFGTGARRKWNFFNAIPGQHLVEAGDIVWNKGANAGGNVPLGIIAKSGGVLNGANRTVTPNLPPVTVATVDISNDLFTTSGSNLSFGNIVRFTTDGSLPAPLQLNTDYYVRGIDGANVFQLLANANDSIYNPINITSAGTGTLTVRPRTYSLRSNVHGFQGGTVGQLTTTGTLPTGLLAATNYYIFGVTQDFFKLATSPANAQNEIGVAVTDNGTGTHTFVPAAGTSVPFGALGVSSGLTATAILDFASIPAQSSSDLTISVPGAAVGDACYFSTSTFLEAGIGNGGCTIGSAGVATVRLLNVTTTAIDPASASFKGWVLR